MTLLTVAIPTYNRARYLLQALDSVLSAVGVEDGNVNVVVSDNASTDDTRDVVADFQGLNLRYHRNLANLGLHANVLKACGLADGDYVMLFSDDDLLYPGSISEVVAKLRAMPHLGAAASSIAIFDDDSPDRMVGRLRFQGGAGDLVLTKGPQALLGVFSRSTNLPGLVIRRDLLDVAGADRHAKSQYPQIYLMGRAAKSADVLYMAKPLVRIRNNPVTNWEYSHDYMANAVMDILRDLTEDEPWGKEVRRKIIRQRILSTYSPLYLARHHSWRSFARTARGLSSVPEYRSSGIFWSLIIGFGLLGPKGIALIRRLWRGPVVDSVEQ